MPAITTEELLTRHGMLAARLAASKRLDLHRVMVTIENHTKRACGRVRGHTLTGMRKADQLRLMLPKRISEALATQLAAVTGVPKQTILDFHSHDVRAEGRVAA